MSLHDWIYSVYPPDAAIDGRWGLLHISVLLLCILAVVMISLLRTRDEVSRKKVIRLLAAAIAILELSRRIINLSRGEPLDAASLAYILLPRPWCAISCWMTMAAVLTDRKRLYNFSAMISLLCALVFFAYPGVGFNHKVILFENFYSIATHSLLLVTSISMMTLGLTDFRHEKQELSKMAGLLAGVYLYAAALILLNIEADPLYFMPGNDVQSFLGVKYPVFLLIYVGFLAVYFSAFYLISHRLRSRQQKTTLILA